MKKTEKTDRGRERMREDERGRDRSKESNNSILLHVLSKIICVRSSTKHRKGQWGLVCVRQWDGFVLAAVLMKNGHGANDLERLLEMLPTPSS